MHNLGVYTNWIYSYLGVRISNFVWWCWNASNGPCLYATVLRCCEYVWTDDLKKISLCVASTGLQPAHVLAEQLQAAL